VEKNLIWKNRERREEKFIPSGVEGRIGARTKSAEGNRGAFFMEKITITNLEKNPDFFRLTIIYFCNSPKKYVNL
jgi:hypothetical protein